MPTTRPLRPSSTTIGNSTRESPTVSWSSPAENPSPVSGGMITPASAMNTSVIAPSTTRISPHSDAASAYASRRRPFSSSSEKTGTKADDSAASATSARIRFGSWKANVNADAGPLVPK